MKIRNLILLILINFANTFTYSASRYDYSDVTRKITLGCNTKLEQAKAIYQWLCENISYDTTYSIYHADECFDNRRGVCQAYCELFKELGRPIGLEMEILSGKTKTDGSHAWLFIFTQESTGILVDPTWGAGSVNGKVYTKNKNHDDWFWVEPEWMIFTHYPEDERYQFLSRKVTKEEFDRLPELKPALQHTGLDCKEILRRCLNGEISSLPEFYDGYLHTLRIINMPMQRELRVGQFYEVEFARLEDREFAMVVNDRWIFDYEAQKNSRTIRFIPADKGEASLLVKGDDGSYHTIIEYKIAQPTAAERASAEEKDPLSSPILAALQPDRSLINRYGIDSKKILELAKSGKITSLPVLYDLGSELTFKAVNIPLNGVLKVGQRYTLTIKPSFGNQMAIINGKTWIRNWSKDSQGNTTITFTPVTPGTLNFSVQKADKSYYSFVKYTVEP